MKHETLKTPREYPILMQTDMSLATREDRKTVTRRITGKELHHINQNPDEWEYKSGSAITQNRLWDSTKEPNPNPINIGWKFTNKVTGEELTVWSPYGCPGDWLWVRETWLAQKGYLNDTLFKAGISEDTEVIRKALKEKWKPSIHMHKWRCRTWLENVSIRPERLHDITEGDAAREGIECNPDYFGEIGYRNYSQGEPQSYRREFFFKNNDYGFKGISKHQGAVASFYSLFASIHSWDFVVSNPWVLRVEFKVLSKEGRPV